VNPYTYPICSECADIGEVTEQRAAIPCRLDRPEKCCVCGIVRNCFRTDGTGSTKAHLALCLKLQEGA
jgi:hypothetical protein